MLIEFNRKKGSEPEALAGHPAPFIYDKTYLKGRNQRLRKTEEFGVSQLGKPHTSALPLCASPSSQVSTHLLVQA